MCRPLYRALFRSKMGKQVAVQAFKQNEAAYHVSAPEMIRAGHKHTLIRNYGVHTYIIFNRETTEIRSVICGVYIGFWATLGMSGWCSNDRPLCPPKT